MNKFSVFIGIPEFTKGLVRELRVRWAHEEMGIPYEEIRYPHPEVKTESYMEKQPFGQVPYFVDDNVCMFETGAILMHLALKHNKLLPNDEKERAKVLTWIFAPLNSIEPWMFHYFLLKDNPDASEPVKKQAMELVESRLDILSKVLGDREYFGDSFSIAEIFMTTVIKTSEFLGMLDNHVNLKKYVQRNESRPAFQRALKEHVKLYEK